MAAGLLSFAKLTEWPSEALGRTDTVSICVMGDAPVAQALEKHVKGRLVGDRPIAVSQVTADASLTSCHLLWVSGFSAERAGKTIAPLRDLPVLTIGDVDGFTDSGGIARLFFEHGSLRFRVKVEHAKRARLTISSHVLRLAQGP
jgi:hypothetical protein